MRSSTLPENKVLIESSPLQPAAAEEEEPRPRFGLSKHYDVGSFLAGAVALCSVQIISGVALSNFLLFGNSFDPYVHVFLEVLQVFCPSVVCCCFFGEISSLSLRSTAFCHKFFRWQPRYGYFSFTTVLKSPLAQFSACWQP